MLHRTAVLMGNRRIAPVFFLTLLLLLCSASTVSAFSTISWSSLSSFWAKGASTLGSCVGLQRRAKIPCPMSCSASDAEILELVEKTKQAASSRTPFSASEIACTVQSLKGVAGESQVDWSALSDLLLATAHEPHKDWSKTKSAAQKLSKVVGGPDDETFRKMFFRVLRDGNWDAAASASPKRVGKPWVVLVCGLNGIRKTTSIYEPWFKDVLFQALDGKVSREELPIGTNSFFRQLDYMIATIANEEFAKLYQIKKVDTYAARKDSIFVRYRTVAEMLGALLCAEALDRNMNVMVETSGRDVAMYEYVDFFFPDDKYRKLAVNFVINDIKFAESGISQKIIEANAGGPYGSQVLAGVQADSVRVWESILSGQVDAGKSWYKASIKIDGVVEGDWTASAVGPMSEGSFTFVPLLREKNDDDDVM